MKTKLPLSIICLTVIISLFIFLLGFNKNNNELPSEVYQVYVDGEIIGTIKSEEVLDKYINDEQSALKAKYNVDNIYTPVGVEIKKVVTYPDKLDNEIDIYNKIKTLKPFTVKGTVITIKADDIADKYIYVLKKDIFDDALTKTIKSFVGEDNYQEFMDSSQPEIKETGSIIENIYVQETLTYKEDLIPTNATIYTDSASLAKYLLYGTDQEQSTYTTVAGDTIESVANTNQLSVQEFLIANPQFKSANTLLYESQQVVVGLISPVVNVLTEKHVVENKPKEYTTEIQYDSSQPVGYEYETRAGEEGLYKVVQKEQYLNGQFYAVVIVSSTELKPAVNRILVKGDKIIPNVADESYWAWPTKTPYQITSDYAYRWGSFHDAIDIAGCGYGSPIYAANNGTVYKAAYGHATMGNYIIINHNTGKYTIYMHLSSIYIKEGQVVSRGQVIAGMGNTGNVVPAPSASNPYSGTHLHFGLFIGGPPYGGGSSRNPLILY